jgi:hypothetical protein
MSENQGVAISRRCSINVCVIIVSVFMSIGVVSAQHSFGRPKMGKIV